MDALGPQQAAAIWESLVGKQDELGQLLGTALGAACTIDDIKDVTATPGWRDALNETQLTIGLLTSATGIVITIPKSLSDALGADSAATDKKWRGFGEKLQSDFLAELFTSSSIQVTTPEDVAYIAASLAPEAACLEINLRFGGAAHKLYMVWPLAHLILLFTEPPPEEAPAMAAYEEEEELPAAEPARAAASPANHAALASGPADTPFQNLPDYAHSLMQIKLPVMVTLARQKLKVKRVLEIAPGSLIQFDKFCEDMLDVEAADRKIALGEAVKVGDKFGIKITSIVMPPERFNTVAKD